MMKKALFALAATLALSAPVHATAAVVPYVNVVRVTPGAAPSKILAFQNTSTTNDVVIRRIEIANASTQTVSGGQAAYWVYLSTQLTHSAAASSFFAYGTALAAQPSYISVSTAPLLVQYEGDSAVLTGGGLTGVPPVINPLVVDNDDAATVNRSAVWYEESQTGNAPAGPLLLTKGSSRALVIEKRQGAASDFTAGSVEIRIFYTVK